MFMKPERYGSVMGTNHAFTYSMDSSRKWSLSAGLYMFICGTVVALLLSDMLSLLADVIGLPPEYWMLILASPAFAIGAGVWWAMIERHGAYTYLRGSTFGFVTALLTGGLWTGQFIRVWGFEMAEIPIIAFIIAFVLGVVAIAGVLTAIPLMYARRRLDNELAAGTKHTV
jgi:lipopolysaccharide export LptBFGC system permease protein LptF